MNVRQTLLFDPLNVASEQVVEITKGSKVKYELDKKTGLIKVIHNDPVSSYLKSYCPLVCTNKIPTYRDFLTICLQHKGFMYCIVRLILHQKLKSFSFRLVLKW